MTKRNSNQYEPMLLKRGGKVFNVHTHEVKRNTGGFVVVTRHYSLGSAEQEARLNGGEVVRR